MLLRDFEECILGEISFRDGGYEFTGWHNGTEGYRR